MYTVNVAQMQQPFIDVVQGGPAKVRPTYIFMVTFGTWTYR